MQRNSTYKVIFKNPCERMQTNILGQRMFPGQSKFWNEVVEYCHSSNSPVGSHIFLDLHKETPDDYRVRTNVFPGKNMICFAPLKNIKKIPI